MALLAYLLIRRCRLMFLLFINELAELLERYGVKVKLFADDVKLYLKIVNEYDADVLQAALKRTSKVGSVLAADRIGG